MIPYLRRAPKSLKLARAVRALLDEGRSILDAQRLVAEFYGVSEATVLSAFVKWEV